MTGLRLLDLALAVLMLAGFCLSAIYQVPPVAAFFAIVFIACVVSLKGRRS